MPKLLAQTIKLRDVKILKASQIAKDNKELGYMTGNPGKNGSKNPDKSAVVLASQNLAKLNLSMLDALAEQGVTPVKIAKKIDGQLDSTRPEIIDKGIIHSLKIGVGGGYAPEKSQALNLNVGLKISDPKLQKLNDEYNQKVFEMLKDESPQ